MNRKSSVGSLVLCVAAAALPGLAAAAANDYSYVEGGLIHRDDYGHSNLGGRVAGSFDLSVPVAPFAEYTNNDHLEQISVGGVFHAPIRRDLNWFAGASLEHVSFRHGHDTGFGIRGGFRWQAARNLELSPEIRYVDAAHDGQVSARLSLAYAVASRLDVIGAVQGGDDDRFEAGVRYRFGSLF
jgi:hypothetical protein